MHAQSVAVLPKSRLLRFTEQAFELAKRVVPRYSSKFSKRTYTLRQHLVLLCLKVKKQATYRDLVDELIEMPRIRETIGLDRIPHPSTLCKAFDRLSMSIWRGFLRVTLDSLPLNGVTGIDASGFERSYASNHYTQRTGLKIKNLKTTLLVDSADQAVIDVHITTTRKHDTQIAPQIIERSANRIDVLTGDKGYDDRSLREQAQGRQIRPLLKHREFSGLHKAWNERMGGDLYNQRNMNETANAAIKRKYGSFVRSRVWYRQFRELVIKCVVQNIETALVGASKTVDYS